MRTSITLLAMLCVAPAALGAPTANEPILVNHLDDAPDADPGDGVCDADLATPGEQRSLRAAVMHANATPGPDTIRLDEEVYRLTLKGAYENDAATGDLDVLDDLTVEGRAAELTIIDARKAKDRVFDVLGTDIELTLRDVTLEGGRTTDGPEPWSDGGGGIRNFGIMLVERCTITKCKSHDDGGGVESFGDVSVIFRDTLFLKNKAKDDGAGIDADDGVLVLERCTFSGNKAKDEGGALEVSGGHVFAVNSTFWRNKAKQEGGAFSVEDGGVAIVEFCTFAGNKARHASQISAADDGAAQSHNSIFSGKGKAELNTGTLTGEGNLANADTSGLGAGNQLDVDPRTLKLADNGGFTPTVGLKDDSPAVDAAFEGMGTTLPDADQRGVVRKNIGVGGSACDVGAFEVALEGV